MPKLKLKVTHTHAGAVYPAGHIIDVDEHTVRWLIDQRVGEPVTASPAPAPEDAPAKHSTPSQKE